MRRRERQVQVGFGLWVGGGFSVVAYRIAFPDGPMIISTILLALTGLAVVVTLLLLRRERKQGWL